MKKIKRIIFIAFTMVILFSLATCDGIGGSSGGSWETVNVKSIFGTNGINAIAFGNDKFVAVGDEGKMGYSSDGANWTAVSDSKFGTYDIESIVYGGGKFVAVGESGKMSYSSDGINWTAVTDSKFGTNNIILIAYGNKFFVAISNNYAGTTIGVSNNGIDWTAQDIGGGVFINALAFGNGKFVLGGSGGYISYIDLTTSTTGTVTDKKINRNIQGIAYGDGKFIAVGDNGSMAYSSNLTNWTAVSSKPFNDPSRYIYLDICSIIYGGGQFISGYSIGTIMTSSDGISWEDVDADLPLVIFKAIAYGNDTIVASGWGGELVYSKQ